MLPWKNVSPKTLPFTGGGNNMAHTPYGPIPAFGWGNFLRPGTTPVVPPPTTASAGNTYTPFAQMPALLSFTGKQK